MALLRKTLRRAAYRSAVRAVVPVVPRVIVRGLFLGMLSAVVLDAQPSVSAAPFEWRTPAEVAAAFQPDAPGWVVQNKGYGGSASGN